MLHPRSALQTVVAIAATLTGAALAAPSAAAQGFTPGDLYLFTPAATGIHSAAGGVIHIVPQTGATTLVAGPRPVDAQRGGCAYDPFRDRVLFAARLTNGNDPLELLAMDATGATQPLGITNVSLKCLAPTGDGRVYVRQVAAPAGRIRYLDAANQLHDLLDASGTQPFEINPGSFLHFDQMIYHAPTNALIVACQSNQPTCAGGTSNGVQVWRAFLSADGTRSVGPVNCSAFEVSTSGESPVGLSLMPDGDLLLVVDTNSNATEPRMIRVNPYSLAMSTFASNGHAGAAATNAGCFSRNLGRAVILDTGGDQLRSFAAGTTGSGTIITPVGVPVSSAGSSGEVATLIEIGTSPCPTSSSLYGDATAGAGGYFPAMTATGCPTQGSTVFLHVSSAVGAANGALFVGTTAVNFPILGGTLLVNPLFTVPLSVGGTPGTPGAGAVSFPLALGNPGAISFMFQTILLDAAAPQGLSMTNGLQLDIL